MRIMSTQSARQISPIQLHGLMYRKHLNHFAILCLIVLCCVLLSNQLSNSFIKINNETATNKFQSVEHQTTEKSLEKPCESPLKTKLKNILKCRDMPLHQEMLQYGDYWLLKNYIRGLRSRNIGCAESITYATNGDYTFMENLPTVIERWLAPVSFSLYAPGDDYQATMDSIQYVRNCLPQSDLVRDYVTFHIFFPKDHIPNVIARSEQEALDWPYNCELKNAPYINANRSKMYKTLKNLTYPINVVRNIARKAVNTYFIFVCDIELHPSLDLVNKFLEMVVRNPSAVLESEKPRVFVLPVFEVKENATLPNNKTELQNMLNTSLAVPFHKFVCSNCHLVPKQEEWVKSNDSFELEIFSVGKRYDRFASWEPFYISDNKEPIFDERVTWEGQSNKRIQNYAMCLLDYDYIVLHPAFLVHTPGIKVLNYKSQETNRRFKYAAAMNKVIYNEIMPEYRVLYGKNKRCAI